MKAFLPDQTRVSQVHLRTRNLDRAEIFYREVLGLASVGRKPLDAAGGAQLSLSGGPDRPGLLLLEEDPAAAPHLPRSLGLYHFALRYPSREDLARAYARLLQYGYPVTGAADHGVSEAIYLRDPEGNGIELYADRPRSEWRWENGELAMVSAPLDLEGLLRVSPTGASTETSLPPDLGHIHLHVASLENAERFYGEFLGLAVTQRTYPGALFFAAGGYHHHLGVNVWGGSAAPLPNQVGLISYRLEVPMAEILYCLGHRAPLLGFETRVAPQAEAAPLLQIRDPNGFWLEVQVSAAAAPSRGEPCVIPA